MTGANRLHHGKWAAPMPDDPKRKTASKAVKPPRSRAASDAANLPGVPQPTEVCSGCGVSLPAEAGPVHPYMLGSAACWRGYGELLAVQYSDPERMRFHQLVVDAYAAQHPGDDDPRAVQSVAIHLMTLALFLESGVDPARGTQLHKRMVARPAFHRLHRPDPSPERTLTFQHVPLDGSPDLARDRVYEWASSVWASWGPHHDVVRRWLATSGLS